MTATESNTERIWNALPGTSKDLAAKAGVSVTTVQRRLRIWQDDGRVDFGTRWFSSLAYTRVYYRNDKTEERE